ncbi:MAG: aldolase/citrate lyase family protein [Bacteroidetes bacterium]|nr:aldolase/citrate lyase family protein [Bacteroidota bacterium]MCL5027351.1 aldolase/citrate lyase family protein [Chloroflexota bacterium]
MMRENPLKKKLKAGEVAIGAFQNFNSPEATEIVGLIGFDFVIFDAEHGPMNEESCLGMLRAAEVTGITPIVRIAMNIRQNILRYLDAGAMGVQIPMVQTKEEARAVVDAVKYPPVGLRGLAGVRSARWGLTQSLGDYVKQANEQTMVITHVENLAAAKELPRMLEIPEIDVIFVGPTDLSSSMGLHGQLNHPEVVAMVEKLAKQIRDGGKAAGTIAGDPATFKRVKDQGFQYIAANVGGMIAKAGRDYLAATRAM